jgi:hypothetical protein
MAASSKGRRKNRPKPTSVSTSRTSVSPSQKRTSRSAHQKGPMLFGRMNYLLLGISIALLIVGYSAMAIDNQIRSFTSLYFAPVVLMTGYLLVIYAIFYRPKKQENVSAELTSAETSEE